MFTYCYAFVSLSYSFFSFNQSFLCQLVCVCGSVSLVKVAYMSTGWGLFYKNKGIYQ